MADLLDKADEVKSLIKTIDEIKGDAKIFIGVLVFMYISFQAWRQWLTHKQKREEERGKEERARRYLEVGVKQAESISRLAESMSAHTVADVETTNKLNSTLISVEQTMETVHDGLGVLTARTSGQINRDDATKMIRDRFLQNIFKEISFVIERSLTENDYEKRKDFVARKVRTALGDILIEARKYLCGFNLAVDPTRFFMCEPNQSVERFILCDSIWKEIEPLFKKEGTLKQRIEEAYLIIENVIGDYVTLCSRGTDSPIQVRRAHESNAAVLMSRSTRLMTDTAKNAPLPESIK